MKYNLSIPNHHVISPRADNSASNILQRLKNLKSGNRRNEKDIEFEIERRIERERLKNKYPRVQQCVPNFVETNKKG